MGFSIFGGCFSVPHALFSRFRTSEDAFSVKISTFRPEASLTFFKSTRAFVVSPSQQNTCSGKESAPITTVGLSADSFARDPIPIPGLGDSGQSTSLFSEVHIATTA